MSDIDSEDLEQMHFVQWMRRNHPDHRLFAIPNGGLRSASQAAKMKVTGVSAGIPDMMIPSLKLFIEMKRTKGGTVSPEQKEWIAYLRECGYTAEVAQGCDAAIEIIKKTLATF